MRGELLDPQRPDDAHTATRLGAEPVIWFGSTRPDGRPHQVPVWFSWSDPEVVVFSMPSAQKVRNIVSCPSVTLHLEAAAGGTDVVLLDGTAVLADEAEVGPLTDRFAHKYRSLLGPSGPGPWRAMFSQPILVTATRVVAWTRTDGVLAYRTVPSG